MPYTGHTHGEFFNGRRTTEYVIWMSIKDRCFNPNSKHFAHYGGRGITLCDEWRYDLLAFIAHVGRRPSKQHSIDRIDNNRGYEPGNVRWATATEQNRNRSCAKLSAESARWIKLWLARGMQQLEIAKAFGVTRCMISRIKCGLAWKEIEIFPKPKGT